MHETNTFDATILTLKILSCIIRAKEKYGAYIIAATLHGNNDKKIKQFGLDKITTYGIATDFSVKQIIAVIYYLIYQGLLQRSPEHNNLNLTLKGKEFLKNKPKLFLPQKILDSAKEPIFSKKLTPTHFETLNLWQKGFDSTDIAKQRNLAQSTIESHLADIIYHGKIKDISRLVSKDNYQIIYTALQNNPGIKLSAIKERLPADITFGQIKIVLALAKSKD